MGKKILLALFCTIFIPSWLNAAVKINISPEKIELNQGETLFFNIYYYNNSPEKLVINIKNTLESFLKSDDNFFTTDSKLVSQINKKQLIIEKGQFRKLKYKLILPFSLQGMVKIKFPKYKNKNFYIFVSTSKNYTKRSYKTIDAIIHMYQPYMKNLTSYKPIYFLAGTDLSKSKFQLSFKYRFIDQGTEAWDKLFWLRGIHLGYTQTSFWDLESESIPFKDSSYKPEFFYLSPNISTPTHKDFKIFLQSGLQHESNGRGGEKSKSTNFLYFKPIFLFFPDKLPYGFLFSPKIFSYIKNEKSTNKDLYKYRGYFELQTSIGKADSFLIESYFYWGKKGGSISVDYFYPIHKFFKNINFFLQVQYSNVLAESLIDYKKRNESIRFGIAIVR